MILAGDVGGTKCSLGLFRQEEDRLRPVFQSRLATRDYPGFDQLIAAFLKQAAAAGIESQAIEAAGFGVAGVVVNGRHLSENLPWVVDASALKQSLGLQRVRLLNDLAATALSLERLGADDVICLNAGVEALHTTRAVIAAGTGLGTAILFWDGGKYRVAASELGHTDFAPHSEREIRLLSHLRKQFAPVSCEEIASGRGFRRIHEFLNAEVTHETFETNSGNAASEISQRGLAGTCGVCAETLDIWAQTFAAMTGNFALQTMALAGVYIAGGIAVKILPKLRERAFFDAFCGDGKLAGVLKGVPLSVVVNEDAPMLGAAYEALMRQGAAI